MDSYSTWSYPQHSARSEACSFPSPMRPWAPWGQSPASFGFAVPEPSSFWHIGATPYISVEWVNESIHLSQNEMFPFPSFHQLKCLDIKKKTLGNYFKTKQSAPTSYTRNIREYQWIIIFKWDLLKEEDCHVHLSESQVLRISMVILTKLQECSSGRCPHQASRSLAGFWGWYLSILIVSLNDKQEKWKISLISSCSLSFPSHSWRARIQKKTYLNCLESFKREQSCQDTPWCSFHKAGLPVT